MFLAFNVKCQATNLDNFESIWYRNPSLNRFKIEQSWHNAENFYIFVASGKREWAKQNGITTKISTFLLPLAF